MSAGAGEAALLLDLCPELGEALAPHERQAARERIVIQTEPVSAGAWDPSDPADAASCLIVHQGLLLRETVVGDVRAPELVGEGDVVNVSADAEADLLGSVVIWTALDDARVGHITAATFAEMGRWPAVLAALMARSGERCRRLAVHEAICNHVRVDARIVGLLWHLAERFGRVTPAGVVLPLSLTHDAIAAMVGAQRPTVSTALGALAREGTVSRRDDGAWMLRPDTDEELARLFARARQTRSADAHVIHEPSAPSRPPCGSRSSASRRPTRSRRPRS